MTENSFPQPPIEEKKSEMDLWKGHFKSLQTLIYKNILKILTIRFELPHLVVLVAGLGLMYRGNLLIHHLIDLKESSFSIVSEASAESPTPAEKPQEETDKKAEKADTEQGNIDEMDPLLLNEDQIKVLLALAKQKKDINETNKEADVEKQKKIVEIATDNLKKKIDELDTIKHDLENKKAAFTKNEINNIESMAKLYETMKPSQAADIFNKLELTSLTQIIKHMNPKKAAAIVAAMTPERARIVTIEILGSKQIRELPSDPPPSKAS